MASVKSHTRDNLLLALANALADEPRASMGQLAVMVGLSRATLCRHFPSRDAMMQALFDAGFASVEQAIERAQLHTGSADQAIRRMINELLPIVELYACVDQHTQNDAAMEAKVQPLRASLILLFQDWQKAGELRVDLPAAWLLESTFALLRSAAVMIRSERLARHDAVDNVYALLWQGIAK